MHTIPERHERVSEALRAIDTPVGVGVRAFSANDFPAVQGLTISEGWTTPGERPEQTLTTWLNSWPALVATDDGGDVIGFLRALTDGEITTYIGEIIVAQAHRGSGVGRLLMEVCGHMYPRTRLDLLTDLADGFYQTLGCREFRGYRVHPIAPFS